MARKRRRSKLVGTEHRMFRNVRARTNRFEWGMMADKNICGSPMSVSALASGRLEGEGETGPGRADTRPVVSRVERRYDERGRLRSRQESKSRMAPAFSGRGVRTSIFAGTLAAVTAVLSIMAISSQLSINRQAATNEQLRSELERATASCTALQAQIDEAQNEVDVAYSAKDYGLVSAGSLPVILLQAPQEATVIPVTGAARLPSEVLAVILGQ